MHIFLFVTYFCTVLVSRGRALGHLSPQDGGLISLIPSSMRRKNTKISHFWQFFGFQNFQCNHWQSVFWNLSLCNQDASSWNILKIISTFACIALHKHFFWYKHSTSITQKVTSNIYHPRILSASQICIAAVQSKNAVCGFIKHSRYFHYT